MIAAPGLSPVARTVLIVGITQIFGWGGTFQTPLVFARAIAADLDVSYDAVFLGITAFLIVGGLAAPFGGTLIDRHGGRRVMTIGALVLAAGLIVLGLASNFVVFLAGWALLGIGSTFGLYTAAYPTIAQIAGIETRRAIGLMTIVTVASVLIIHPLNAWMEARIGWRAAYLVYAGVEVLLCAPLTFCALPERRDRQAAGAAALPERFAPLAAAFRRRAMALFVVAFALQGFIGWGVPLHLVVLFRESGIELSAAVWIAGLMGPAQAASRIMEITVGERWHPVTSALIAFVLTPIGLAAIPLLGASEASALLLVLLWGLGAGIVTLTRASIPLVLFGREGYGATMGRLALPQNLVFAFSPVVFAQIIETGGPLAGLLAALGLSAAALIALLFLARLMRRASG